MGGGLHNNDIMHVKLPCMTGCDCSQFVAAGLDGSVVNTRIRHLIFEVLHFNQHSLTADKNVSDACTLWL